MKSKYSSMSTLGNREFWCGLTSKFLFWGVLSVRRRMGVFAFCSGVCFGLFFLNRLWWGFWLRLQTSRSVSRSQEGKDVLVTAK
jgi:hypothetical protein